MSKKSISKRDLVRRLKIIEGHLKKVTEMVEDDKYCIDILQQTAAVKNALKKVEELLLDKHLHSCVIRAIKKDKSEKSIQELLEIFRKSK
jgi:DNA-binding FrmR family transcriptional regulator